MRDIPVFTTEFGVSHLIFKEVPYRGIAYIKVLDVQPGALEEHLRECRSFCRMAGAERIFASGHPDLERWPLHTKVLELRGEAWGDRDKLRSLFPVTENTVSRWRQVYNERMRNVDNASTLETRDEAGILASKGAYFVHENGDLLGIGWLEDTKLLAVASVKKGAGERVMHSLMSLVEGASVTLEVASTNLSAIRLYEKLGFLTVGERSGWYDVSNI